MIVKTFQLGNDHIMKFGKNMVAKNIKE